VQPTTEKTTEEQSTSQPTNPLETGSVTSPSLGGTDSAMPPSQPQQVPGTPLPVDPPKRSKKKWLILILLVLLVAGSIYPIMALTKKGTKTPTPSAQPVVSTASSQKKPYLFITDYQTKNVTLTDSSGKKIYSTSVNGVPTFVASSPGKQVFLSSYDNNTQITTYTLLDKDGKAVPVNQSVQKTLSNKSYINKTFAMLADNIVLAAVCTSASPANACQVLQLNITSGEQKTLLEISSPSRFTTGESIFDFVGNSSDHKLGYLLVGGPTKLGNADEALYSFDPATSQAQSVSEFPKDRSVENLSVSPDDKKLIYSSQTSNAEAVNIYTVNIATKKENSANWDKNISGGSYSFVWSPDNSKVSLLGNKLVTGQVSSIGPLTLAYLDFAQNKITNLQTIEDSDHQEIQKLYWLNNTTLVYGIDTTTAYHDFTNSTGQVYKQSLSANTGTKVNAPAGHLIQLLLW
jgi:hypothetical protein